ncbi:rCG43139 [Rattus norvegicus]|uniref:RCG43139 n=1 Tax=Rattus norvegicus TaxID=10116 RepID=A6IWR2_RAT|nr:rCG43139 [Rattus norvegicus]
MGRQSPSSYPANEWESVKNFRQRTADLRGTGGGWQALVSGVSRIPDDCCVLLGPMPTGSCQAFLCLQRKCLKQAHKLRLAIISSNYVSSGGRCQGVGTQLTTLTIRLQSFSGTPLAPSLQGWNL